MEIAKVFEVLTDYLMLSGFGQVHLGNLIMIGIGCLFIALAIRKGYEPLLLVPIGFGILIGNIPYDSSRLPLSVYDGPVSEHYLHYYEVSPVSITMPGRNQQPIDFEKYKNQYLEETLQNRRAARVEELRLNVRNKEPYRHMSRDEFISAIEKRAEEEITADKVQWDHRALTQMFINARVVRFDDDVREVSDPVEALRRVHEGQALIANSHALLIVRLPADFQAPGVYDMGQGRQVFVERIREDNKYPQVWTLNKQDPHSASVLFWLFTGVGLGFFPPLIFLGVGALTDFGPMLSNPKTLLLGAASQLGIFGALLGAAWLFNFSLPEAASIGIIGGADGPTAIFTCSQLAPHLLGPVALAAYSYMALVPIIQPPIMRLLTTKNERRIRMKQTKPVSKNVKILFPIIGFLLTAFIANGALPLLGMLFLGNLLRECGVTNRLAKTAQTSFIDIVTILLGVTVGAKTNAANFLTRETIFIFLLGIVAFALATAGGLIFAKIMNMVCKEKINPLIGAAGVSAVPMAARVAHRVGQEEDPQNYLLMHAMGPNVAGVIGSAVAAGVLLSSLALN